MRDTPKDLYKELLGRGGERRAERYLNEKGLKTLARNEKTPFGEADLILRGKDVIVFCEVKTRESGAFGAGREAVDARKRARYGKIAEYYLMKRGIGDVQVRFDVVEIQEGRLSHLENAFFV